MSASSASARGARSDERAVAARTLAPAEIAWLAVLPCAALATAAIMLLGPPLGHAAFERSGADRFWPRTVVAPEPVEHARFVIALLVVPLLVATVAAGIRLRLRLRPRTARSLVAFAQVCTLLFLGLMLLAQHDVLLRANVPPATPTHIFSARTIVAAVVLATVIWLALARRDVLVRLSRLPRETPGRRVGCAVVVLLLVAAWLSAAFNTEHTIGLAEAHHLIPWDMSETFAVLDGRTPLVDFHSQYAQLLPYVAAGALRAMGATVGAWTATMIVLSGLGLLAVFAVLRRVAGGSLPALALFVPFLAGSAFLIFGRLSPVEIFALWPMRYGGPYLLAWLTARHLDGETPHRRRLLLGVGGLVALNNLEFGAPACAGALAACAYIDPPCSRRAALRLLIDAALGLLAAVGVVTMIALWHGGALPRFGLLLEFPRIYGIDGWVLEPMPAAGLHIVLYVTFVAAIVVATVRAVRREDRDVLTGMLVWSGVFGLGAGSYYVGRSDALNLISLFSAWCLSLVLLAVVVIRNAADTGRRPSPAAFAVLLGCCLVASGVFQLPRPWAELERLQRTTDATYAQLPAVRLVKLTTRPGEKVVILIPLGHRIAFDAGVIDVAPYTGIQSMPTVGQLETTLDVARRERVRQVYVDRRITTFAVAQALREAGFVLASPADQRYVMLRADAASG